MFAIRQPRTDDLPALKALLDSSALPSSDLTEQHLEHFVILAQANRVAGSVGLEVHGENALLRSLAVETMMRGDGLGTRLLELIEEHAREHGVQRLFLLTTSAESFFMHHGYERSERAAVPESIRRTAQFDGICPSTAACLAKTLS
ncbi:MAG TPA: arsenic resistance N-acetyltransferase ArsN2 [Noviherbaspirillum sp.]|uniref:arsenic resistance N-acetyltransferase ArsN2 n=1 Tax=Noviherbaspirillum sp. TaxID=1926288 RepID=UPI002D73DFCC|nr:arsenic resistance N-acetyltransferase ArsN2 [Noviherbaspirillum sp.]HYD96011.1 arsenic resistance N-acetyltransferase ArsN2 [Noviherbaspirillum sp.]